MELGVQSQHSVMTLVKLSYCSAVEFQCLMEKVFGVLVNYRVLQRNPTELNDLSAGLGGKNRVPGAFIFTLSWYKHLKSCDELCWKQVV